MRAILLTASAFVLLAGCTAGDGHEAPTTTTDAAPPGTLVVDRPAPPAAASDFTTAILEDGTYQHPHLEIGQQTTLIWWNVDDLVHSVVSDDGQFAGSGPIAQGEEFVRTFQTAGEYSYHCRYHVDMTGVIVVR